MRYLPAIVGASLAAALLMSLHNPAKAGSEAFLQSSNNDRVIAAFNRGGSSAQKGDVSVTHYGGMGYLITSPSGIRLFIDPWRNDPSGTWGIWFKMQMPVTAADIGMSTHAHFDHDAFERLDSGMILDRMAGTWEFGDIRVTGIPDKHECNPQGLWPWGHVVEPMTGINPCPPTDTTQWDNVMYVIETGGIRFLHWGDNRHNPPNEVWDQLTNIDVAFLAVDDSGHILNGEWALDIEKKLQPKIVFPAHYYIQGITVEASTLMPASKWVKAHENHEILDSHTVTFNPDSIKDKKRVAMYFGYHVPFDIPAPPADWTVSYE